MTDELAMLRRADPVPRDHPLLGDSLLDARAESELHRLVAGAPVAARRRTRWAAVAAGAAAFAVALALGAGQVLGGGAPAVAATPPLLDVVPPDPDGVALPGTGSREATLAGVAERAREATGPQSAQREAAWREWSLSSRVAGEQVTSAVLPQESELSWRGDGSGTVRVTVGEPWFPTEAHREAYREGGPDVAPGATLRAETVPAGGLAVRFPQEPPADAASLRAYLAVASPPGSEGSPGDDATAVLTAVGDLHREWRLTAAQRAALVEVLAGTEGLRVLGSTTDRLGRAGVALAADSDVSGLPTRTVVVLDPGSGEVLSIESWLTRDAGELDVEVPAVVSYTAFR
ncbi:CU044_5270 family protein [Thalassiella azotivora]